MKKAVLDRPTVPTFAGCIRAEGERQLEEVRRTLCSPLKPPESKRADGHRDRA